uniref:Chromo domain-containing protein n=1 Tax=Peronospora matthiolae TaxID=2874970 RepID=A0AAV1V252_9STRA
MIHSGRLAKQPAYADEKFPDELQSARHEKSESNVRSQVAQTQTRHYNDRALRNCNRPLLVHGARNAEFDHEPGRRVTVPLHGSIFKQLADQILEPDQMLPTPQHPLLESGGVQRVLVERILNHRDVYHASRRGVRTSYLVRWRGNSPAWDSWEHHAQLIVDSPGLVEESVETHPLRMKKGRWKMTFPNASTWIAKVNPFGHLRKDARPPVETYNDLPMGKICLVQKPWT